MDGFYEFKMGHWSVPVEISNVGLGWGRGNVFICQQSMSGKYD